MFPLVGKRYYCKTCGNFDLCVRCQARGHPHRLIPVQIPRGDGNNNDVRKNS